MKNAIIKHELVILGYKDKQSQEYEEFDGKICLD